MAKLAVLDADENVLTHLDDEEDVSLEGEGEEDSRARFECKLCLKIVPLWQGRCPSCGSANCLVPTQKPLELRRTRPAVSASSRRMPQDPRGMAPERDMIGLPGPEEGDRSDEYEDDLEEDEDQRKLAKSISLTDALADAPPERILADIEPLDRVLGGGAVRGTVILLGGDPGTGKSSLLLQALSRYAKSERSCLYGCGEEHPSQVAERANKFGILKNKKVAKRIKLHPHVARRNRSDFEYFVAEIRKRKPDVLIVDSLHAYLTKAEEGSMGSTRQVKSITKQLSELMQEIEGVCFLICHITKGKTFAGPKTVEHLVDATFMLKSTDKRKGLVLLTSIKNRYGSTSEEGLFQMTGIGKSTYEGLRWGASKIAS